MDKLFLKMNERLEQKYKQEGPIRKGKKKDMPDSNLEDLEGTLHN